MCIRDRSLSLCVESLETKYNLTNNELKPWETKMMGLVEKRIKHLKFKITVSATKPLLQNEDVISALAELQRKFVIVPIDKASITL